MYKGGFRSCGILGRLNAIVRSITGVLVCLCSFCHDSFQFLDISVSKSDGGWISSEHRAGLVVVCFLERAFGFTCWFSRTVVYASPPPSPFSLPLPVFKLRESDRLYNNLELLNLSRCRRTPLPQQALLEGAKLQILESGPPLQTRRHLDVGET